MDELNESDVVFLKPRTKLQPLSCRWPAWPHLLAPAQHAMNIAYRHVSNLRSFVSTPSVHVAAGRDPAMLGGPFVCLEEEDVGLARDLLNQMTKSHAHMIRFAEDYRALNTKLQGAAKGASLDEHYSQLPPSLAGLVELVYDLNHHPEVRVQEEILYAGGLDNTSGDELCLRSVHDTERQFFMSTPVIEGPGKLFIKARFDDPVIDCLSGLRTSPRPLGEIASSLAKYGCDTSSLSSFLTRQPPERRSPQYTGEGVRVRYFGHACVLLQTSEVSILMDPLTAWERDEDQATLTFDDLPDFIDYVVITHGHQDHLVSELLLQLRNRVGQVIVPRNNAGSLADPSLKLILRRLGFRNITVVDPLDRIEVPGGEILALPFSGEHCTLPINTKLCAAVRLAGRSFGFLVDSDGMDPMMYRRIRDVFGGIDVLFLGMECHGAPLTWLYGPLLGKPVSRREDESRRLNGTDSSRAWSLIEEFKATRVIVYAMGQECWLKSIMGLEYTPDSVQITESDKLMARCQEAGISAERPKGCREFFL
jgi:L-ascorbate metabolism protein UlaG (beta-lactamase superfamily)